MRRMSRMEEERRPQFLIVALLILTLVVFGGAIYLQRQSADLRNRAQSPAKQPISIPTSRMSEGIELPEFTARDTEGRETRIAVRGDGNTLLFIFNPTCNLCEAGMRAWVSVSKKL